MNRHLNSFNAPQKQLGLSLFELLIAMTIGLFLLAGIASSYSASKRSSIDRNELSVLEDNGRFALEIITKTVEHAGYIPSTLSMARPILTSVAEVSSDVCPLGGVNNVVDTSLFTAARMTSDSAAGDSLAVVHSGDASLFSDCTGLALPVGCRLNAMPLPNVNPNAAKIYNSFFIGPGNTLQCAGSRNNATQVMAQGVENIQFLYGVDTSDDGNVNQYLNATAVSATNRWGSVVSIQVALLVRSLRPVKTVASSKTYTLLDTTIASPVDKFKRDVFSTTIHLRNAR